MRSVRAGDVSCKTYFRCYPTSVHKVTTGRIVPPGTPLSLMDNHLSVTGWLFVDFPTKCLRGISNILFCGQVALQRGRQIPTFRISVLTEGNTLCSRHILSKYTNVLFLFLFLLCIQGFYFTKENKN